MHEMCKIPILINVANVLLNCQCSTSINSLSEKNTLIYEEITNHTLKIVNVEPTKKLNSFKTVKPKN